MTAAPQQRGLGRHRFAVAGLAFDGVHPFAGRPADIPSTARAGFGPFARSVAGSSDLPDFPGASASGPFPFVVAASPNTASTSSRTGARQGALHGLNSGATRCASQSLSKSNCASASSICALPLNKREESTGPTACGTTIQKRFINRSAAA